MIVCIGLHNCVNVHVFLITMDAEFRERYTFMNMMGYLDYAELKQVTSGEYCFFFKQYVP